MIFGRDGVILNIKPKDMTIIKEDNRIPRKRPLGRILKCYPASVVEVIM